MSIRSNKLILVYVTIGLIVLLAATLVVYLFLIKDNNISVVQVEDQPEIATQENVPPEAPSLPETPSHFLGKTACDLFSDQVAAGLMGEGLQKTEPMMTQSQMASITTCEYTKENSLARVKVYRYFDSNDASKYLDGLSADFKSLQQKDDLILVTEYLVNNSPDQESADELLNKIVEKL